MTFDLSVLAARVMRRVSIDSHAGCWIFTGAIRNGYGVIGMGPRGQCRTFHTHRVMYEQANGQIGQGLEIDHLCRIKSCCNPAHLEAVTHLENVRRGKSSIATAERNRRRAAAQIHCLKGHPLSGDNLRIRSNGKRECVECTRARDRTRAAEKMRRYRAARTKRRLAAAA